MKVLNPTALHLVILKYAMDYVQICNFIYGCFNFKIALKYVSNIYLQ